MKIILTALFFLSVCQGVYAQEKPIGLSYLDPTSLDSLYWEACDKLPKFPNTAVEYILTHTDKGEIILTVEMSHGNEFYIFTKEEREWKCNEFQK